MTATMDELWNDYRAQGYDGVRDAAPAGALDALYLALLAFNADAFDEAAQFAHTAANGAPQQRVYREAAVYLDRVRDEGKANVYVTGDAFAAFIRGGGNVPLYAAVSEALRTIYAGYDALHLLDIGVGDGLALLPALTDSVAANLDTLDLIEPSEAMLEHTVEQLRVHAIPHAAHNMTLQTFMQQHADADAHWDVIQATWSLQSIAPDERAAVFAWLRAHGDRVLIAEFDVPDFTAMLAPDRVRYVVTRYEHGLAEYQGDGGIVAQGFLMPVMVGYFDRSAARTNWEGPLDAWVADLRAAGFEQITTRPLYEYFWADAYLIDAR